MADVSATLDALRYPIGKFRPPASITTQQRQDATQVIAELPAQLHQALQGLDAAQLDTPYREGGWTVRQVVHHLADSHMTAFHRLRRALTEDDPVVAGYDEKAFAQLADSRAPMEWSLQLIEGLHARWALLLQSLDEQQWKRGFRHQERGPMAIDYATQLYAWHSSHHVAHIVHLRRREGW
jgi:uncharacterized damage-inducible protein DinB